jgi:2-methylcitrate dehydratase PrpD
MNEVPADVAATSQLASFIVEAKVPAAARRTARRYLLDWLGSALSGGKMRPPSLVREVVTGLGGHSQATVLASGERTSAPLAALANAAASHVLEMDDLDPGSIYHPAAPTVSAALAVAEHVGSEGGADGDALLDAIAIGYEVGIRVGEALGPSHYEYWHTTGTAGTFGAAASAARLHGLTSEETLYALGSAGTTTAGLWEFLSDGAMSKQLHPAKAAHDGILSVLLAQQGFTAATHILEGPRGVLAAMSPEAFPERLTDGLASEMASWRIEGVAFKVHAACRHTHSAVDAALQLRAEHGLEPGQIEKVHVRIYEQALGLLGGMEPTTAYAAKFSLPFCIAAALQFGDLGPGRFSESTIRERTTLALADKVSFSTDLEFDALYPAAWPSLVSVTMTDGREVSTRVDHPAGDIKAGLENSDLASKFALMTGGQFGDKAGAVADQVLMAEPAMSASEVVRAVRTGGLALVGGRQGGR